MKLTDGRLWPAATDMGKFCGHILLGTSALAGIAGASSAMAQSGESVSRAVVQPLPPPSVSDLGDALRRLARNARDVDALIDAGNASLKLNDIDAAIGFFGRAQDLSPENARVKLGLAGAFVRSGRPIEALRLFDEAERAGASTAAFASERGLAYDLVGDSASAQAQYRRALAAGQDAETVRRLAISQAISGDREGFEKTLLPQLESEDYAGFRTRAFGLAILGDEEEAVAIAETVMPRDLSAQIAPYLRYMGRLTKAQKAAAANLGMFPRAAQIGRDDPRIAQYTGGSSAAAGPPDTGNAPVAPEIDDRLTPAGEPLGPSETAPQTNEGPRQVASAAAPRTFDPRIRIMPQAQANPAPVRVPPVATSQPAAPAGSAASGELPPASQADAAQTVVSRPVVQALPEQASAQPAKAELPPSQPVESSNLTAANTSVPTPGFDLAAVSSAAKPAASIPSAAETPLQVNVADAFASFKLAPAPPATRSAGAVDITLIDPPREIEKEKPAAPKPPEHPRRFWVQVATGRNVAAFKYDWRRISEKAPEVLGDFKPMTTPWVEANRLLAGPFETEKAAEEAVGKLREAGLDSFTFTSEEGQEIVPLG